MTDLRWTRESNMKAYQLAVRLRGHYREELSRRGLSSPAALAQHYDGVRLKILDGILRSAPAGYRASDARVLIGTILWRQGKRAEAMRSWRELDCAPTDSYLAACTQLTRALPGAGQPPANEADLAERVARVMKNEQGRWWDLSYDRLRRFGYRFDTY